MSDKIINIADSTIHSVSLSAERERGEEIVAGNKGTTGKKLTPKEILSWLPADATPAQQDSAIQRHIKPSKITWSNRPDTLHLPGHPVPKDFRKVELPQYYRESFFSKDSLFHPELKGGRPGVAGDPIPYTIANDDLITGLLLGCFMLGCVAFAQSRGFIIRHAKNFFYAPRSGTTVITETTGEIRFQLFLGLITSLLLGILYFFYMRAYHGDTFILEQYKIIGVCTGVIGAYFLLKAFIYWFTGWVFFGKKNTDQWMKSFLFILSSEGILLFPLVLLQAYFKLSIESSLIYSLFVIILIKILSLYKEYVIFFRRKGAFLQIISYFCALEIVPLFTLWNVLGMIADYMKINF